MELALPPIDTYYLACNMGRFLRGKIGHQMGMVFGIGHLAGRD
jgi:hypothetical protein